MITYLSTRGKADILPFEDAVLAGLASDGGLFVPSEFPQFSTAEFTAMASLSYPELAARIMQPFVGDALDADTLHTLLEESYAEFSHSAIAPLTQLNHTHWLLELFHGPTLAFKDFALQFLGRLLDHFLQKRKEHITILGATSGDTGSAAIAGCRGRANMDSFILHPHGRVSEVQRRQMTTVRDANIHNIAIKGTFDDCQNLVKTLFGDSAFRTDHKLAAVNSINWARVLAQVVYYVYAALALGAPARAVSFSVPTGNFGDIYAGYIAKRIGLPIHRLIIATNRNDILARTLDTGSYSGKEVLPTLSPSMDIQVSSNFERLLFDLYDRDAKAVAALMEAFNTQQQFALSPPALSRLRREFSAATIDDDKTKTLIGDIYTQAGAVIDPHTAVGIGAARTCHNAPDIPCITLATAHPAKFPDAVKAACGLSPALPAPLADLFEREERYDVLPAEAEAVKAYIRERR